MSQNPTIELTDRQKAFQLLRADLPTFARHCLKIRDKSGRVVPFIFNKSQMYTHQKLEEQKKKVGFVRAIILKGRQSGQSTYVAARFFQRTLLESGISTFIMSHQAKTTGPLFDIVKRFIQYLPSGMAPLLDTANKNQLKFANTASEYTIGTAGSEEIGRGFTIHNLHLSEAAFYEHGQKLETGLLQAVADIPGTEVIMESTANGLDNFFYSRSMKAMAGMGHDQLVFLPWYWCDEYSIDPPAEFFPDEEEQKLMEVHKLNISQIYWRRKKIETTSGGLWQVQQEYPMSPNEAFLMSGETFLSKERLSIARKTQAPCPNAPVVMGVDCARENDRSVFVLRRGREIFHYEVYSDLKAEAQAPTQALISIAAKLIDRYNVQKVFIDAGYGWGVVDGLHTLGYRKEVTAVNFGQKPLDPIRALNKRAEMALLFRDWIDEGNVSIPDKDDFVFDLLLTPREKESPSHRIFLPKKSEIRAKHKISTDIFDATILTFSFPVFQKKKEDEFFDEDQPRRKRQKGTSELVTINRMRNMP